MTESDDQTPWVLLQTDTNRSVISDASLVLTAMDIANRLDRNTHEWLLYVPSASRDVAQRQLERRPLAVVAWPMQKRPGPEGAERVEGARAVIVLVAVAPRGVIKVTADSGMGRSLREDRQEAPIEEPRDGRQ